MVIGFVGAFLIGSSLDMSRDGANFDITGVFDWGVYL
jgi:ABC-type phosphate/phosphonate transport system permease subunit